MREKKALCCYSVISKSEKRKILTTSVVELEGGGGGGSGKNNTNLASLKTMTMIKREKEKKRRFVTDILVQLVHTIDLRLGHLLILIIHMN